MKTSEMIKMLEDNPELKFKAKNYGKPEVIITVQDGGLVFQIEKNETCMAVFNGYYLNCKWELINEPVDLITAIKAFAEGKQIKSVLKTESVDEVTKYQIGNCDKVSTWGAFIKDTLGQPMTVNEILYAKWYIED